MSNFTGMDIAAVRALAHQFTTQAQEIRTLAQTLSSQIEQTPWVGPDRERFYSDWTGQYAQGLHNVAQGLDDAAQRATMNADEQESAST